METKNFVRKAPIRKKYIITKVLLQSIQQWRDKDEKGNGGKGEYEEPKDDGTTEESRAKHARSIKVILEEVLY